MINHRDEKIIEAGYKVVSERSIDKVGTQIKDVYEYVLNKKNGK